MLKCSRSIRIIRLAVLAFLSLSPLYGDEPYRGWEQTETEHFRFIYEKKDEASVEELLTFCEEVYANVAGYFNYYPEKVTCVIRGRLDIANGSYAAMPNRINLYVPSPSGPWLGSKTENWLKALLTHELTHYIHLTYNKGFMYILGEIFGRDLRVVQAGFQPGWMIEGITVALETEFSRGGRGRNPFFELYWKAPIIEDRLFSLRQASYMSSFPPRGRIYAAGYMIVSYMMDRFGKDVFREIHREFVRFPFFGPRFAIEKVTGFSAGEIYTAMKGELEEKYAPFRELPSGKRVTPPEAGDYHFPVITGGGWYVYRRTPEKTSALVRFDPDSGKEEVLLKTILSDENSYAAPPDGGSIYFTSYLIDNAGPAGQSYISDLYRWNELTGKTDKITENAHILHPAVSPDGDYIAAVEQLNSYSRLVKINPDTGEMTPLFHRPGTTVYTPDISPDGSSVVFTLNSRGMQDVWLLDTETGKAAPLFPMDDHGEYNPRFTGPETILFSSDREGDLRLYRYHTGSGVLEELYRDRVAAVEGEIRGNILYYSSYSSDGWCVKKAAVPEQPEEMITAPPGPVSLPPPETAKIKSSKAYIDFPTPLVWAPVPAYLDPLNGGMPEDFGIGLFTYGASYLSRSEMLGYITFPFTVFQPSIFFDTSFQVRSLRLFYTYRQVYREGDENNSQLLSQSLSFSLPVLSRYALGTSYSLSLSAGLHHSYSMWRAAPFHLFNWFDFSGFSTRQRLYSLGGAGFSLTRAGSPADMFSPLQFVATAQVSVPLPINPDTPRGAAVSNTLKLQFPSFFPRQFFRIGAKTGYTSPELLGSRGAVPRGAFDPEAQPYGGTTLFALDYLISFGVFDQPLPLGFNMFGINIQGLALGLHFEVLTDWEAGVFAVDEYLYTGIELIFDIGASLASVPVGIGLSFRFDRTMNNPVSIAEDLRPYIFIGLDSFLSTELGSRDAAADRYVPRERRY